MEFRLKENWPDLLEGIEVVARNDAGEYRAGNANRSGKVDPRHPGAVSHVESMNITYLYMQLEYEYACVN